MSAALSYARAIDWFARTLGCQRKGEPVKVGRPRSRRGQSKLRAQMRAGHLQSSSSLSGTSPNVFKTTASLKLPIPGSPERLNASAPALEASRAIASERRIAAALAWCYAIFRPDEGQGDIISHGHLDLPSGGLVLFLSRRDDLERAGRQRALQLQRLVRWRRHPLFDLGIRREDHRHCLGMDRTDFSVGISGQEGARSGSRNAEDGQRKAVQCFIERPETRVTFRTGHALEVGAPQIGGGGPSERRVRVARGILSAMAPGRTPAWTATRSCDEVRGRPPRYSLGESRLKSRFNFVVSNGAYR